MQPVNYDSDPYEYDSDSDHEVVQFVELKVKYGNPTNAIFGGDTVAKAGEAIEKEKEKDLNQLGTASFNEAVAGTAAVAVAPEWNAWHVYPMEDNVQAQPRNVPTSDITPPANSSSELYTMGFDYSLMAAAAAGTDDDSRSGELYNWEPFTGFDEDSDDKAGGRNTVMPAHYQGMENPDELPIGHPMPGTEAESPATYN